MYLIISFKSVECFTDSSLSNLTFSPIGLVMLGINQVGLGSGGKNEVS